MKRNGKIINTIKENITENYRFYKDFEYSNNDSYEFTLLIYNHVDDSSDYGYDEILKTKTIKLNNWNELSDNGYFRDKINMFKPFKPKIKAVHLLSKIEDEREQKSIASISKLKDFGIEYVPNINKPYTELPPAKNCARPQDIGMNPSYMILSPGHYGCHLAHKNGILENINNNLKYLLIFEADAYITVPIEEFIEKANRAYDYCKEKDLSIFSFGPVNQSCILEENGDFCIANKCIEMHAYLIPDFKFDFIKNILNTTAWDVFDLQIDKEVASKYHIGYYKKYLSLQTKGVSLIDLKQSNENYLGIEKV